MLMPGVLLAISGSMIAPRIPVWRMLPVTARDIDRARWWHSVGGPGLILALLLAVSLLLAQAGGNFHASWRDVGLSLGGQFACCVTLALVWMAMPLARRKWGRWSGLIILPLMVLYFRLAVSERGDLRPSLEAAIPIAVLVAAVLYGTAGRWPVPQTTAMWAAPSGEGAEKPSRFPGWPALFQANLPIWLWFWGFMAFGCLALKYFLPHFNLGLFGWIFGLMSAQFLVIHLVTAIRVFRALPLSGARLTAILVLLLLCVQGLSLSLFALVLTGVGNAMPVSAFAAPLIFPLVYFPAALRFGMRIAQIGYALAICVLVPFQLLLRDGSSMPLAMAGLLMVAMLAVLWIWGEIARGHLAYRIQPLVPARWRGAD
jgi:hypothetical protein